MAEATSHEQQQILHLPPSPPPSPASARRRQKKRHDSFEKLASTPLPSPPSSPTQGPVSDTDEEESWLARIVLTPVLFISFILSLSFVNLRDRANRARAHSSASVLTYLSPSKWLDIEPYQDPDDSSWGRGGAASHVEPHDTISPKQDDQSNGATHKRKKSWHLNKKIRKVARLEVSDAFDMRGRVIVVMMAMLVLGSVVLWFVAKWLFVALVNSISGQAQ